MEAPDSGGDFPRRWTAPLFRESARSPVRLVHPLPAIEHPTAARRRRRAVSGLLILSDVVAAALCLRLALLAGLAPFGESLICAAVAVLAWATLGLDRARFQLSVVDEAPRLLLGALVGVGVGALLTPIRLGDAVELAVLLTVVAAGTRWAVHNQVRRVRSGGRALTTPAVLFGTGTQTEDFRRRIIEAPQTGLRLVGHIDPSDIGNVDAVGPADEIFSEPDYLMIRGLDHRPRGYLGDLRGGALVAVGAGQMVPGDLKRLLRACHVRGVETWVASSLDDMAPLRHADDHLAGMPIARVRPGYQQRSGFALKRVFDVVASAAAIVLLSPLLGAVALAVRRELGPGVLFRQERVGRNGELFNVLKFRSMPHADSPRSWGSAADDSSIGPVGRFIRRFSLDELPQLFNIVRGDMSIVGPRPEQPRFVDEFSERFPGYSLRHRVPVGLTGLAAVEGLRGNTSLRDRVHYDNLYIENWSIWLDVKILARTLQAVITGSGE